MTLLQCREDKTVKVQNLAPLSQWLFCLKCYPQWLCKAPNQAKKKHHQHGIQFQKEQQEGRKRGQRNNDMNESWVSTLEDSFEWQASRIHHPEAEKRTNNPLCVVWNRTQQKQSRVRVVCVCFFLLLFFVCVFLIFDSHVSGCCCTCLVPSEFGWVIDIW